MANFRTTAPTNLPSQVTVNNSRETDVEIRINDYVIARITSAGELVLTQFAKNSTIGLALTSVGVKIRAVGPSDQYVVYVK